jgi:hypothetical protein
VKRGDMVLLSVLAGDTPPTEFRVFAAGANPTKKGVFIFDAQAAKDVMAAYAEHATDGMIDLEHLSLDPNAPHYDPDARAWYQLELRPSGELWAVNVKWTDDGAIRLTEKRQRFISQAFIADKKTKRIKSLHNIAITAQPASHGLEPLVAANVATGDASMDPAQLPAIAQALGLDAGATVEDILAAIGAAMKKIQDGAAGVDPEAEPMAAGENAPPPDKQEMMAARATLLRDTGAPTVLQAMSIVSTWRESHDKLEADRVKLASDRAALLAAEQRSIGARLVRAGQAPAIVWDDDDATTLTPGLAGLTIEKLRAHVAKVETAAGKGGGSAAGGAARPASGGAVAKTIDVNGVRVELSATEVARCEKRKAPLEKYAEIKLRQGLTSAVNLEG